MMGETGALTGPDKSRGTGSYVGVFPVVFDLSSAYGNVGLSLGYPGASVSTSGVLSGFSKLVMAFMCLHGYCMGIFPATVAAMELPPGIEGPITGAEDDEDDNIGDALILNALELELSNLTPAQMLSMCHSALAEPLMAVSPPNSPKRNETALI